jgi:hypothetical protein
MTLIDYLKMLILSWLTGGVVAVLGYWFAHLISELIDLLK